MKKTKFSQILDFKKKSHLKAGDGLIEGAFPFFTSSPILSKYINISQFDSPSLIFGTGGNASIHMSEKPFSVSTDCVVAQLKSSEIKNFEIRFIYYYLSGNISILENGFKGAGLKHISKSYISNIDIPFILPKNQKRIVAILDQADALRQKRKQAIELLDEYVKSVFLEMFGDPVSNPKGWEMTILETLGNWKSGGTPSRKNKEYFDGHIPWYSSGELNKIYIRNSNEKVSKIALIESSAKEIPVGSLLLGMYDTAALKSSISTVLATCNQAIAFAKLNSKIVETIFVYFCIQYGRSHYMRLQRGVRQKNLNLSMIKELKIISPPLEKQKIFSETIKRTLEIKQKMLQQSQELDTQFNALMQRAFNGELTE